MQRRILSPPLFIIGLAVLVLCTGTFFFQWTPLDPWLTLAMAALGLILCIVSFAILVIGPKSPTIGRQAALYGAALFLYGFANMILGIVTVFFGATAGGNGLGVGAAVGGLLICVLSGTFMAAAN